MEEISDQVISSRREVKEGPSLSQRSGIGGTVKNKKSSGNNLIRGSQMNNLKQQKSPQAKFRTHDISEKQSANDGGDSYYDNDEFESMSMSKSMGGIGMGLTQGKNLAQL